MRPNKSKAKFGVKWWDRYGHCSTLIDGIIETHGCDDLGQSFTWPRLCAECKSLLMDTPPEPGTPASIRIV